MDMFPPPVAAASSCSGRRARDYGWVRRGLLFQSSRLVAVVVQSGPGNTLLQISSDGFEAFARQRFEHGRLLGGQFVAGQSLVQVAEQQLTELRLDDGPSNDQFDVFNAHDPASFGSDASGARIDQPASAARGRFIWKKLRRRYHPPRAAPPPSRIVAASGAPSSPAIQL